MPYRDPEQRTAYQGEYQLLRREAAEPDSEALELLGDVLRLAWRRHGLQDPTAEADDGLRARMEAAERRAHAAAEL